MDRRVVPNSCLRHNHACQHLVNCRNFTGRVCLNATVRCSRPRRCQRLCPAHASCFAGHHSCLGKSWNEALQPRRKLIGRQHSANSDRGPDHAAEEGSASETPPQADASSSNVEGPKAACPSVETLVAEGKVIVGSSNGSSDVYTITPAAWTSQPGGQQQQQADDVCLPPNPHPVMYALANSFSNTGELCEILGSSVQWTSELFFNFIRMPALPGKARMTELRLAAHVEPDNPER